MTDQQTSLPTVQHQILILANVSEKRDCCCDQISIYSDFQ